MKRTTFRPVAQQRSHLKELLNGWMSRENGLRATSSAFVNSFRLYDSGGVEPLILEVTNDKVCKISSKERVAVALDSFLNSDPKAHKEYMNVSMTTLRSAVTSWAFLDRSRYLDEWPKPFAFKGDAGCYCFHRLDYDPDMTAASPPEVLKNMLDRMDGNAENICARIGSVFDFDCDRKQAVWLYGPKDCGKSSLTNIISELIDTQAVCKPSVSRPDNHLKEGLVGKRLAIIDEAATSFVRSNLFKSLTGDLEHSINPKGLKAFTAPLPLLYFMTANEAPKIPDKDELRVRLITSKMEPIPSGEMMGEKEFREAARAAKAQIAGYCILKYNELKTSSGRIPNDLQAQEEGIENYSEDMFDMIETCFEKSQSDKFVLGQDVGKLCRIWFKGSNDQKLGEIKRLICQRKGAKLQVKRVKKNRYDNESVQRRGLTGIQVTSFGIQLLRENNIQYVEHYTDKGLRII